MKHRNDAIGGEKVMRCRLEFHHARLACTRHSIFEHAAGTQAAHSDSGKQAGLRCQKPQQGASDVRSRSRASVGGLYRGAVLDPGNQGIEQALGLAPQKAQA